ncbi:MAG: LacI family DNA-binding transcriptional regulator [Ancalomicrobiaceae bacterium]|nr:LacI family DNA-binding transcriptional regulator [Ancalomicrobiaceae bacterium]
MTRTFTDAGVGIKDVAAAASVSTATVSRVLSGGSVSPALKERVEAAVRATGYRPNLSARRLRSKHSRTIGLIVSDIRNPFFTALSRSVEDVAFRSDMRVILCNTDESPEREAMYLRLMEEERVTGMIIAPTRQTADRIERLSFDFPVVLVDRTGPLGTHDAVVIDNLRATRQLIEHLVDLGHRRIGGIFGNTSSTAVERHEGYAAAMLSAGLTPEAHFTAPTIAGAATELARWLGEPDHPRAFIASNGLLLLGMVKAVRAAGLSIPADVTLAGFDNELWTELIGSGLSVIEQPIDEIGQSAMSLLFDRLERPDAPPRKMVLSGRLIERTASSPAEAEAPPPSDRN